MAHEHPSGVDADIFIGDGVLKDSAGLDHSALHEHTVGYPGALLYLDPAEEDTVFHFAVDDAAVGHQRVDAFGLRAVVGGGIGLVLSLDGAIGSKDLCADLGVQQFHTPGKIAGHGLEPG